MQAGPKAFVLSELSGRDIAFHEGVKEIEPKLAWLAFATGLHVLLWGAQDQIHALGPAASYALSLALIATGVALAVALAASRRRAARTTPVTPVGSARP